MVLIIYQFYCKFNQLSPKKRKQTHLNVTFNFLKFVDKITGLKRYK